VPFQQGIGKESLGRFSHYPLIFRWLQLHSVPIRTFDMPRRKATTN